MRVILDTNIVISGLIWGGVPRQLLNLGREQHIQLFTSTVLLDELESVLSRDKFAKLLASQSVTPSFIMQRYGLLADLVTPQTIQPTVRDSDDDVVLATALAAQAKIIVSGDNDLLVLHPFQHIHILNAADVLHHIQTHMTDTER